MFTQQPFPRRSQRRARHARHQWGVTLIETVVTLGIAGSLAAIGVPSLTQVHDKAAVQARFESFTSALRLARQEAMARGELVTVCALDPRSADSAQPACLPKGKDWSAGWLVFIDRGDRGEVGEGDTVRRVYQAPGNAGSVAGTQRYLTYRSAGELLSPPSHFRFLPPGQPAVDEDRPASMLVCVNKPGRPRVTDEPDCEA